MKPGASRPMPPVADAIAPGSGMGCGGDSPPGLAALGWICVDEWPLPHSIHARMAPPPAGPANFARCQPVWRGYGATLQEDARRGALCATTAGSGAGGEVQRDDLARCRGGPSPRWQVVLQTSTGPGLRWPMDPDEFQQPRGEDESALDGPHGGPWERQGHKGGRDEGGRLSMVKRRSHRRSGPPISSELSSCGSGATGPEDEPPLSLPAPLRWFIPDLPRPD